MENKINLNNTPIQGSLDVKAYVYKILSYWKLFFVTILIALIAAKFLNGYKQKIYSLNTTISVKEETNPLFSTGTNIAFNWGGASNEIETVRVILKSRTHNEKVVDSLNFFIEYLQEGRYRLEDVYGQVPFSIDINKDKPQLYNKLIGVELVSENRLKVSVDFIDEKSSSTIVYNTNKTGTYVSNEPMFSKEYFVNENIDTPFFNFKFLKKNEFKIGEKYFLKFLSIHSTVGVYRSIVVNEITKAASMLKLELFGVNKRKLEDYLNATVDVLKNNKKEQKIVYAKKTKNYIDKFLLKEEDRLKSIEKEIGSYKEDNGIFNLSLEGSEVYTQTIELDNERRILEETNEYLGNLKNYILSHKKYDENIPVPALVEIQDSKIIEEINLLIVKSTEREALRSLVTDDYPALKQLNNEVRIAKNNLVENITTLKIINTNKLKKTKPKII